MNKSRVLAIALATAIVASLLVLYFDWRARLHRRILAERNTRHELDKAAEEKVMLQTNTTTYRTVLPLKLSGGPVAVDVRADEHVAVPHERQTEVAMDDALAASFPASDPPAWNPGVARPIPVGTSDEPSERL